MESVTASCQAAISCFVFVSLKNLHAKSTLKNRPWYGFYVKFIHNNVFKTFSSTITYIVICNLGVWIIHVCKYYFQYGINYNLYSPCILKKLIS
jgi:hypothetical protein